MGGEMSKLTADLVCLKNRPGIKKTSSFGRKDSERFGIYKGSFGKPGRDGFETRPYACVA